MASSCFKDIKSKLGERLQDLAIPLIDYVVSFMNLAKAELALSKDRNIMRQKASATSVSLVISPDCLASRYSSRREE
jgi:hypothetical protein